jgi:hypothetical protein
VICVGIVGAGSVGACLLDANRLGLSNTGCMQDYLNQRGITRDTYFGYERHVKFLDQVSEYAVGADACVVFTGAAGHENSLIRERFQPCISKSIVGRNIQTCSDVNFNTEDRECKIPPTIWSGGSKNTVDVANLHQVSVYLNCL